MVDSEYGKFNVLYFSVILWLLAFRFMIFPLLLCKCYVYSHFHNYLKKILVNSLTQWMMLFETYSKKLVQAPGFTSFVWHLSHHTLQIVLRAAVHVQSKTKILGASMVSFVISQENWMTVMADSEALIEVILPTVRAMAIPKPYTNKNHYTVTLRTLVLDCTSCARGTTIFHHHTCRFTDLNTREQCHAKILTFGLVSHTSSVYGMHEIRILIISTDNWASTREMAIRQSSRQIVDDGKEFQ